MPYGSYCCLLWCANNGKTNKKLGVRFSGFHGIQGQNMGTVC
ncbi:unnamed protein product [Ixodes pacificus]